MIGIRILLLGKNGQVGWELQRSLAPLGELLAVDRHGTVRNSDYMPSGLCGDLSDLRGLAQTIRTYRPDIIVNAAAYTAVDKAENEPQLAELVNAEAPGLIANMAKEVGAWLVHYSTDYVFNGGGAQPWHEEDATGPINIYGRTKLLGEQAITLAGCKYLIFRTSWVYGARGGNFAKTILRLAAERECLTVISDQIGAPTGAELIADVTAHAVRHVWETGQSQGLYHLAAEGETSWYDYANHVIKTARQWGGDSEFKVKSIQPVPTTAYPTPAARPLNSRLNTEKLRQAFGLSLPRWQVGVDRMLAEIL